MRQNVFKYIFIVVVILLIGAAIYFLYKDKTQNQSAQNANQGVSEGPKIANDIRLAIVGFDTFNPVLSKNKNVQDIAKVIFDPLLTIDAQYRIQPVLAKEWSKTGDTSYVLKLKSNVQWQDGTNFTANDVQFTIDRLKDTQSIYSYNVQHVVSVEVIDDHTVRINLDASVPFFEYMLTFPILSKNYYQDQDFATTEKNKNPVGTGMYKVYQTVDNTITLRRNQYWWGLEQDEAEPKAENILINLYSSMGEVYNNFKMGNLDFISTSSANIEDYIGTIGFNKKEYKGRDQDYIAINCSDTLMTQEVRKAVSYAIDKNAIVANVFSSRYDTCDFPLDYGSYLYSNEVGGSGYNPDQAKQVLLDSGWNQKNGTWQKIENYKTTRLNLELIVNSENSQRVQVAELIKANLEAVGINLKVSSVSNKQYENYLQNKNYQMILTGNTLSISPELSTYFGNDNLANYHSDEVTALMQDVQNITEENLLKEKYQKLAEIYKNQVPYISLYRNRSTVAYSTNLMCDITPNTYKLFYQINKWYRQY